MNKIKTGIEIIADERKRQIDVEGYTSDHDDHNPHNSMACAAACYAMPKDIRTIETYLRHISIRNLVWNWDERYWKPSKDNSIEGRIHELAKAGALIAAEIDRLQRINN